MSVARKERDHLDSKANYPEFEWTALGSEEYWKAVADINNCYRQMLQIGKSEEVFGKNRTDVVTMLTAKTKTEFDKIKKNIQTRYNSHKKAKKGMLKNFVVDTELIPNPRKYKNCPDKIPTHREILVEEQILTFEQYCAQLNISLCSVCRECKIEQKPEIRDPNYVCSTCKRRNDPDYFLRRNMHPVWYMLDDDGNQVKDANGKRIPRYDIPSELSCLSISEKLLIRRCANFVPTFHMGKGHFGIDGHCITFPQDITEMCDELPQRRETVITFLRNIGSKDTSAVFPKHLKVNRKKVLNALHWLKKHHAFYHDIQIKEEHLDWMENKKEVNLCSAQALEVDINSTPRSKRENVEDEHVAMAHSTREAEGSISMKTMHANESSKIPSGSDAKIIKDLVEIAKHTNQTSSIMDFPPIDHDSPVS